MSHGCLARRAPSSPEVNEHYLASLVLNGLWFFVVNVSDLFDLHVGGSKAKLNFNFDVDSA